MIGEKEVSMDSRELEKRRPKAQSFFMNFRGDMPWTKKIVLFIRNNWIKIKKFQSCCGHPGEPGC
jgi:hypothetical protein